MLILDDFVLGRSCVRGVASTDVLKNNMSRVSSCSVHEREQRNSRTMTTWALLLLLSRSLRVFATPKVPVEVFASFSWE